MNDTGGAAFPGTVISSHGEWATARAGMTLLDWFAGQALASNEIGGSLPQYAEQIAEHAYIVAKAMVVEKRRLEKESTDGTRDSNLKDS